MANCDRSMSSQAAVASRGSYMPNLLWKYLFRYWLGISHVENRHLVSYVDHRALIGMRLYRDGSGQYHIYNMVIAYNCNTSDENLIAQGKFWRPCVRESGSVILDFISYNRTDHFLYLHSPVLPLPRRYRCWVFMTADTGPISVCIPNCRTSS